jgi:Tfp pilus assembly protein PilN
MKYSLNTFLAPLLTFGPLFMIGRRQPYPDEHLTVSLVLGILPYVGAVMLGLGATTLLRAFQKQEKELAALRTKLAALDTR